LYNWTKPVGTMPATDPIVIVNDTLEFATGLAGNEVIVTGGKTVVTV
jgi:hypothetical protein